jgi:hypothetical protein
MQRPIRILSFILCFMTAPAVAEPHALPKLIQASYAVTKNGQPFANVHERYVVSGNRYKVESVTKGVGIYALFGERVLTSQGDVTSDGLKPTQFELQQGNNPKRALFADFDWAKNNLQMTVKGVPKDEALAAGTQDLASYAYQFMFLPSPLADAITVTLTTGKKLNQYPYKINAEQVTVEAAGKQYKTLHLVPSNQPKEQTETKELWLAAEDFYVPVRILMVEDNGGKIEQTLTELHVE